MFERLQNRLERMFRDLRGVGKIRESNIQDALSEVRSSLLEADVAYRVVQSFIDSVREKALGTEVLDSVDPGQHFTKIIYDEMVAVLGGEAPNLPKGDPYLKILVVGLQGSGKTTTVAKLGRYLRDQEKKKPLLVPADTARPAAREQLEQLAKSAGLTAFQSRESDPKTICVNALKSVEGREVPCDTLIFDTAGRLHIDEALMQELKEIREKIKPHLTLYVLDAMAGQDAVKSASEFMTQLGFDGVIVTKLDGDARGGAALSVRWMLGKPIYFTGVGEKIDALERLYPDRMASRILGMGDIVTLVEKAQSVVDFEQAQELAKKIQKNQFTLEDFAEQLNAVKKMGSLESIIGLMPGGSQLKQALPGGGLPEKELKQFEAIISSMTPKERRNHQVIDGSRRKRIAAGSGTSVQDINRFLKQFLAARTMMSRLGRVGMKGLRRGGFF